MTRSTPLRNWLDSQMIDACRANAKGDMQAVRTIAARVGQQLRDSGFATTQPEVRTFLDAYTFLQSALRTLDKLPQSDRRRDATVRVETRDEFAAITPYPQQQR